MSEVKDLGYEGQQANNQIPNKELAKAQAKDKVSDTVHSEASAAPQPTAKDVEKHQKTQQEQDELSNSSKTKTVQREGKKVQVCSDCGGRGLDAEDQLCTNCEGHGTVKK